MENKKTNLIVKKLRFSKEEYRKKYTSFEFWDEVTCSKAQNAVIRLSDSELVVIRHGIPDAMVQDGTVNPVIAYSEDAKFLDMGEGHKLRYMGMQEFLASNLQTWKDTYAGVSTIYVVSCFNSFEQDLQLEGVTFKFIGSYKQPVLIGADQHRAMLECCYTEDWVGDMSHNFVTEDMGLLCSMIWNNIVTKEHELRERHKAFAIGRERWRGYKARNTVVAESQLN